MKLAKIIGSTLIFFSCIAGCTSDSGSSLGAGFNDETYVWESFIFPTNRVETTR